MASKPQPPPLEIDGIITAAGLARESRSLAVDLGGNTYRITDEGHARIGRDLRARAERNLEQGLGEWHQPPPTLILEGNPDD